MWYLGNIFMRNYYVSFDMSPYDEHGKDYLQIGIGMQSPADWVPQKHTEEEMAIKRNGGKNPNQVIDNNEKPPVADGEGGGSGFAVFLLILLIVGGIGFYVYKKKQQGENPFACLGGQQ